MRNLLPRWTKLAVASFFALALSPPIWCQSHDLILRIVDLGGPDSPIKASGEVTFREELSATGVRSQLNIASRLVNVSGKTILAYEVVLEAIPDHGTGVHHTAQADYFFRQNLEFIPGTQETLDVPPHRWDTSSRKEGSELIRPKATFAVNFVQFSDGSRFGKSNWGDSLSASRQQTILQLHSLRKGFESSGEGGLRLALEQALGQRDNPRMTNVMLEKVRRILEAGGVKPAADEISTMLEAAQKRISIL